jgi:Ca2+-binding RTX toxin-like protein
MAAVLFADTTPARVIHVSAGAAAGGDGSAARPYATIQAAVSAATPGTAIHVHAGTYVENVKIPHQASGTESAPIWLVSADGPQAAKIIGANADKPVIQALGVDNYVIKNFAISGGYDGVQFSQSGTNYTNLVSNVVIQGNVITGAAHDGVKVGQATNVQILDNRITDVVSEEGIDVVGSQNVVIAHNEVARVGSSTAAIFAKGGSSNVDIYGNYVHDVKGDGISAGGSTSASSMRPGTNYEARDVDIYDNKVVNVGKQPVSVRGAIDVDIYGNYLAANTKNPWAVYLTTGDKTGSTLLYSSDVQISGNTLVGVKSVTHVDAGNGVDLITKDNLSTVWDKITGPLSVSLPITGPVLNTPILDLPTEVVTVPSKPTGAAPVQDAPSQTVPATPIETAPASPPVETPPVTGATTGTSGADRLTGGAGSDKLMGLAGADHLDGGAGDDVLEGGLGADSLIGGTGRDTASYALAGAAVTVDLLKPTANAGEAAGDTFSGIEDVLGSAYGDRLSGDNGANTLWGGAGNDTLLGMGGSDTLLGGAGNDVISGHGGNDVINGGAGDDRLSGGLGGWDRFVFDANWGKDTILDYEDGVDKIDMTQTGLKFSDLKITQVGADTVASSASGSSITFTGIKASQITAADFTFASAAPTNAAPASAAPSTPSADPVVSTPAVTTPSTPAPAPAQSVEVIDKPVVHATAATAGDDIFAASLSPDSFVGGAGHDTVDYGSSTAGLRADLLKPVSNYGLAAGDTYVGIENLIGGKFADVLAGDNGSNVLSGGDGADTLLGMGGSDTLLGGAGNDSISGHGGNDIINGGAGNDRLSGGLGGWDKFVFDAGWGQDTIVDYEDGVDRLDLHGTGLSFSDLHISQVGQNAVVTTLAGDAIIFEHTLATALTVSDFTF